MLKNENKINAREIEPREFPPRLVKIMDEMEKIIVHFFSSPERIQIPFRGFLLEGPPGNGKTELAKQVIRNVAQQLDVHGIKEVSFQLVDSASIAASKWGEAEKRLKDLFDTSKFVTEKLVILMDDIDCLMIKRGSNVAVEWHYSINSILFHQLDINDPSKLIVIATTNRTDLIDEALRSRLYFYEIKSLTRKELDVIAESIINSMYISNKSELLNKVKQDLTKLEDMIKSGDLVRENPPNIRDLQHFITKIYIEEIL